MSEYDEKNETEEKAPHARVAMASWSPWVWIIPVLAIFFAGYLVVRYGFFGGGDITVRFADARGLDRYSPVRFRGAKVGTVQKITIDEKLNAVVVRISMDASMNYALRKGTKFWIIEPGIEGGGLGGILSGTSVGISPGTGDETRDFVGQEYAPVLPPSEDGRTFVLEATGLGSVAAGAPVQFQGMRVGTVLGAEYDEGRRSSMVHVFVVQRFVDHVRQSTRFWRGGGLNVSLQGGGLSASGLSLGSLLSSPIAFVTPEVLSGLPAANGTHFKLYDSQAAAEAAMEGPQLAYMTYFPGAVKGLIVGTPVQIRGVQVGRVREVRLRYVPESASLETPVMLEIDPRKLEFNITDATTQEELRATVDEAMQKLVRKGMRATLATSLVLPGASGVSLEMVGSPGTARLVTEFNPPVIPAAPSGTGIESALASLNNVAARLQRVPIEEIAGHLRSTAARMDSLVHDPALDQSIQSMNRSLADIEKSAKLTRENIGPIAASLRSAATSADAAAKRAEQLMGSSARQDYDLGVLVKELTRAAEAVRALASYLTENPDALLKGRAK